MERATHQRLIEQLNEQLNERMNERLNERLNEQSNEHSNERLRGELTTAPADRHAARSAARPALRVAAEHYRSPARFELEQRALFGAIRGGTWIGPPRVIAASASLAAGACAPIDVPGASLIIARDEDGTVRGFANACRHRGTRLVDAACSARALVCPYHAWTYDLRGSLIHVPHAETFAPEDRRDLCALPVTERHGLIWLGGDIAGYLGGLDPDLAALELDRCILWRSRRSTPRCNWKLIMEAFMEGYHVRVLHRDTIYRFFLDAASTAESVGPHMRAVTARRGLREAPADLATVAELRDLATPSYSLFPGTVVIIHPDFVSVLTLHPLAADQTDYEHLMFVPAARASEAAHWDKSWTLIEDGVFQREDLWVCQQIQRGLASGATDELVFGELEASIRAFHAAIDERLTQAAP